MKTSQSTGELLGSKEDIKKLVGHIKRHQEKKWEKYFIAARLVFTIIAVVGYCVADTMTQKMKTLTHNTTRLC